MTQPNKIMTFDLEVNNNPYYGSLASPKHPDNYVVAVGWSIDEQPYSGEVQYKYFDNKEAAENWLTIPDDVWLLVAHNASFELDWMWTQQRKELMKFLQRGGRIFCTQLGHYRLSQQQEFYPALGEIAPLYGGSTKIDAVTLMWQQGTLTKDIDKDLLIEYLAGPDGDIENTRKVFYGQVEQLTERGMWDAVLAQCDGLIFNALSMSNGLHVDTEYAYRKLDELKTDLTEIENKIYQTMQGYPEDVINGFKITSDYHVSAWLYGGSIKVGSSELSIDAQGNQRYEKFNAVELDTDGVITYEDIGDTPEEEIETLLKAHYSRSIPTRFKSGKNKGKVKVTRQDSIHPLMRRSELIFDAPSIIDLNKYPADFSKQFLKEHTGKRVLADGSFVIGTSEDALNTLKYHKYTTPEAKELIELLLDWAILNKVIGSFYYKETLNKDGTVRNVSGLLQYVTDQGKVHHSLNITATRTGRLSASRPNSQQFSTNPRTGVKTMFTSRFGKDGVVLEADYKALEVVTQACFSKDTNLIKTILEGIDMHSFRACVGTDLTYEEFNAIRKDASHPRHAEIDALREAIKPRAFAYQYGASPTGIAYATGCTLQEAEEFCENERKLFPEIEAYFDSVAEIILANTTTHREQNDNGQWRVYQMGTWKSPSGLEYSYRTYPKTYYDKGKPYEVMEFKPTQMRNYSIQGESSFFVQCATGWIMRWLVKENFFDARVVIVNTVHDSVMLDVHKDIVEEVAATLQRVMEHIPQGMKRLGYDLILPFPVDISIGDNLQDQKTIQDYFKQD